MELQQIFLMYLPILELFPKSLENERLARVWFYVCFCAIKAAIFVLLLDITELSWVWLCHGNQFGVTNSAQIGDQHQIEQLILEAGHCLTVPNVHPHLCVKNRYCTVQRVRQLCKGVICDPDKTKLNIIILGKKRALCVGGFLQDKQITCTALLCSTVFLWNGWFFPLLSFWSVINAVCFMFT